MAKPRSRLSVAADWLYALTRRCGLGMRDFSFGSEELMMSPLHRAWQLNHWIAQSQLCLQSTSAAHL